MTDLDRLKYDALTRQLERMRAMQYAYHRKFFTLLFLSVVGIVLAYWWRSAMALVLLAFGLVTAGVTASFFLHFCDFARTHARALEAKLNQLLGEPLLNAAELEADYFYPHGQRRISGFTPARPDTFFSFFTLHFSVVWTVAALVALWSLAPVYSGGGYVLLLVCFLAWTALNVGFLVYWFQGDAERRLAARLRERLGLESK